jgi:hypothetical protein
MKKITCSLFFFALIELVGCSNSNSQKIQSTKQTPSSETAVKSGSAQQTSGDDIVGDWTLSLDTYDDNGNMQLDDAERKKAFSNHYFYRFSADGSALVSTKGPQGAFKGYYKLSTKKKHQFISVYLEAMRSKENPDGLESEHYIISVDKNELVLLEGHEEKAFWIFKRS